MKVSLTKLTVLSLMLFPITTLLQGEIPILNKALFAWTLFIQGIGVISQKNRIKQYDLSLCILVLLSWVGALFITEDFLYRVSLVPNMVYYFIYMSILFTYIKLYEREIVHVIKNIQRFIHCIIIIWCIIVVISIFFRSAYVTVISWGGAGYFASFSGSSNRLGQAALFIMVLILISEVFYRKKVYTLCSIVPIYCAYAGGSRTYFVLILFSFILLVYLIVENKKKFYAVMIPISIIGVFLLLNSSMMNKVNSTILDGVSQAEFIRKLTNSRSVFWRVQLKSFLSESLSAQIWGSGFNYTTLIAGSWAHNDFIEILCTYGFFGLTLYLLNIFSLIKTFFRNPNIPAIATIITIFIWWFNAFFNFFFCYFTAMVSYPFLLMLVKEKYGNDDKMAVKKKLYSKRKRNEEFFRLAGDPGNISGGRNRK